MAETGINRNKRDAPFVPSSSECVMKFIAMIKLTPKDIFVDLGCGDGRLLVTAAKYAKCHCVGIEIQPTLFEKAQQNVIKAGVSEYVRVINSDFKSVECRSILQQATVIFLYLMPTIMPWVTETLNKYVRKGCRVISYVNDLGRISPSQTKHITIHKWSYPSFGSTQLVLRENKIFLSDLHFEFENQYQIEVNNLEYCQLLKVNERNLECVRTDYDFMLAQRYLWYVISDYYQFRHTLHCHKHKLDIQLRYRYKQEMTGVNYDSFEAVRPTQIMEVALKTKSSDVRTDLKLYQFPLTEADFGWNNEQTRFRYKLSNGSEEKTD